MLPPAALYHPFQQHSRNIHPLSIRRRTHTVRRPLTVRLVKKVARERHLVRKVLRFLQGCKLNSPSQMTLTLKIAGTHLLSHSHYLSFFKEKSLKGSRNRSSWLIFRSSLCFGVKDLKARVEAFLDTSWWLLEIFVETMFVLGPMNRTFKNRFISAHSRPKTRDAQAAKTFCLCRWESHTVVQLVDQWSVMDLELEKLCWKHLNLLHMLCNPNQFAQFDHWSV